MTTLVPQPHYPGISEHLRLLDGVIPALPRHVARLSAACQSLGWGEVAASDVFEAVAASTDGGRGSFAIRLLARQIPGHGFSLKAEKSRLTPQPLNVGLATMGLGPRSFGIEIEDDPAYQPVRSVAGEIAVWRHSNGALLEASGGPLFLVHGRSVITAPSDGSILPSVARSLCLHWFLKNGFRLRFKPIQSALSGTLIYVDKLGRVHAVQRVDAKPLRPDWTWVRECRRAIDALALAEAEPVRRAASLIAVY